MSFLLSDGAINQLADSIVLQYFATTWSQGDATWPDDNGIQDMSVNGDPQATTLSDGSDGIAWDGVDDWGQITFPSSLEGASLEQSAVEFSLQWSHSNTIEVLMGANNDTSSSTQLVTIELNRDQAFNTAAGNFYARILDQDGNGVHFAPSSNPGLNDGGRHDISIIFDDLTQPTVSVIIDGSSVSLSFNGQDPADNLGTWAQDVGVAARNGDGGSATDRYAEVNIGAIRWHDEAISGQTIDSYP